MKEQKVNKAKELDHVIIRFAGDSGDGMQLTGSQFADTSAMLGNDISTFPDYPAEIRAPQGSTYGVSGFQVHIGHQEVRTPGDDSDIDVLIAMNPAALIKNIASITPGRTIIVDTDGFSRKNIEKAGYKTNPLEDGSLENYRLIEAPITSLTKEGLKDIGLDNKTMDRSKNMFALGMVFWMFTRPLEYTINYIETKFKSQPKIVEANVKTLKTGYNYALTLELLPTAYTILPAKMNTGTYRIIMGNQATAWGFIAAAQKAKLSLFLGSYPITPASDILHELTKHQGLGVTTFQAEDEIAGIGAAIGASFAGNLAITTTSGPGLALKGEAIGLALMTELPLVVINVQRGGPSTGLPTKTEQSDLLQSMFGRNGDSPVIVVAASTSANAYDWAYEASRLALEHMTPVILLSDGYIANGSEPWKLRRLADMPDIKPNFVDPNEEDWLPYKRDEKTLARKWAIPGMKGMEHRIGGLEKQEETGNVSYVPKNHEKMVKIRAEKIQRVANYIPLQEIEGAQEGKLLIVGWGGTYGSLHTAVKQINENENKIGFTHFNYINPMPKNIAEIFSKFDKIIVCELNLGQMTILLRDRFPSQEFIKYNKIQGLPFTVKELVNKFNHILATK
ncbi:MAG: 2-oxoglutarate ferredoxin oxidoreductase subunit alpha [Planctomycetota bacterium]|jgi:2-oxoglutarate ferredoxin oxidoreductase subunit alpha